MSDGSCTHCCVELPLLNLVQNVANSLTH